MFGRKTEGKADDGGPSSKQRYGSTADKNEGDGVGGAAGYVSAGVGGDAAQSVLPFWKEKFLLSSMMQTRQT